jgi:hypothetical protein
MIDPATPASVKVRAAEAILSLAARAIEIEDLEARVSALEEAVVYEIQFVSAVDRSITSRLPVRCWIPSAKYGSASPARLRLPAGRTC